MNRKRIILVITQSGKKYIILIAITIIAIVLLNSAILAHYEYNPVKDRNIVIDPGHGGIDGGTNDGISFFEKDINLQIATKLKTLLESSKASVSLTRESDISLDGDKSPGSSRHQRDLMSRVSQFNSGNFDIFISIHVNSSSNTQAIGPIVFFSSKLLQSQILADCIQESLNNHSKKYLKNEGVHNPKKSDLYILSNSNIPGVIVETGFISNVMEKSMLEGEEYQMKLAGSIYTGISNYFKNINSKSNVTKNNNALPDGEDSLPINLTDDIRMVAQ